MSVRDTSRDVYRQPGHAHAQKHYAGRIVPYVRENPRSSRYDMRDDLSIPLESICSTVNGLVKQKVLMDWRTAINPSTGREWSFDIIGCCRSIHRC